MTTHQLARLLLAGPDVTVYVDGYEGDLEDVTLAQVRPARVERGAGLDEEGGEHREMGRREPDIATMEHGLVISRRNGSHARPPGLA